MMTQGLYVFCAFIGALCIFCSTSESKQKAALVSFIFFVNSALLYEVHEQTNPILHWLFFNVPMQTYGAITLLMVLVLRWVEAPRPLIVIPSACVLLHAIGALMDVEILPNKLMLYNQLIVISNFAYTIALMVTTDAFSTGCNRALLYFDAVMERMAGNKDDL